MVKDRLEPIVEIGDDVIVIERQAMPCVERGRRTTHEDRVWNDLLQAGGARQDILQGGHAFGCHCLNVIESDNNDAIVDRTRPGARLGAWLLI